MTGNLTNSQELYCAARMRGLTQRAAYREAYPRSRAWKDETVDKRASELETANGEVSGRLEELRAEAAANAIGTREEAIAMAFMATRKAADEVRAAKSVGAAKDAANILLRGSRQLVEWIPEAPAEAPERAFDFARLIGRDFLQAHRWVAEGRHSEYLLPGGRGSLKTSWVCLEVVAGVASVPGRNAVFMRNQTNKLRVSIYAEAKRAAERLGVAGEFEWTVSPMRGVHRATGNVLYFFGADNVEPQDSQLKGFAPERGHVAYLVFEEASQFPGYSYIRSMRQTILRGSDLPSATFLMWNPPVSPRAWSNVEAATPAPGRAVVRSSYLHAPPEWLGRAFLEQAEALRSSDPRAYLHEFLGRPTGTGIEVFPDVEYRPITDGEIAAFDNPRVGQDFGWWPDPWAAVVSEWRPGSMTLLSWREDSGSRLTPEAQARRLRALLTWPDRPGGEPAYHHLPVASDDAEPSTISQQRDAGVNARAAGKGNNREVSYRFLQAVHWVIDPERCPTLAREARELQHVVVRSTGEVLEEIEDGRDHRVDAVRYSMMREAVSRYAYRGDATGAGE